MKLGEYIREMCINQSEFAKKIGVTAPTITNILSGDYDTHLATAVRIEEVTEGKVKCKDLVRQESLDLLRNKSMMYRGLK